MDFDAILPDVGTFGLYQKLVIFIVLLPAILPCALHAYSQLFIAAKPNHWCRIPEFEGLKLPYMDLIKTISIPKVFQNNEFVYSQCLMFDRNYTELYSVWRENLEFPEILQNTSELKTQPCKFGWNYDKSIFTSTVVSDWNLVCENDYLETLALVLFAVGGLIGNFIFGYLQDFWGRKPSFYLYLSIQIIAGIFSSFTWNYTSWLISRIIIGFTVPAILISPIVLAIELVGPDKHVFCAIVTNIAYSFGLILLSIITYFFRDWRFLSLAVSIPLTLLFCCYWSLPESPRWLIATYKYKRAIKIIKTIGRLNGRPLVKDYDFFIKQKDEENEILLNYGIRDLFATPNMLKKTLIITFIWFSNTSVYVGLSYYAPALNGNEIWNFFLAGIVELPTYLVLWPSLNHFGRRNILCSSMIVGGVACLATFLVENDRILMLMFYCIGKMGISSSFVVLPLAASEIYPTVLRGLGMSFSSVIGMIGPIVIPIINYMGSEILVLPIIIMGVVLVLGGISSLFLPETKNKTLPQTINDSECIPLTNFYDICKFSNKNTESKVCDKCKNEF